MAATPCRMRFAKRSPPASRSPRTASLRWSRACWANRELRIANGEWDQLFAIRHSPFAFSPSFRLARDVVGHHAGEEIAALHVDEPDALEQRRELARPVEMPDRIREVADAF